MRVHRGDDGVHVPQQTHAVHVQHHRAVPAGHPHPQCAMARRYVRPGGAAPDAGARVTGTGGGHR